MKVQILRRVRQGCVLSPDLFNLYREKVLREIEDLNGFIISGHNVTNLRYADDTMLIADSEEKIQALPDRVIVESKKIWLTLWCTRKSIARGALSIARGDFFLVSISIRNFEVKSTYI